METERKTKKKNIFKNSKRGIAAILTLCILLGIAGICVYAASITEENTVPTEETAQELMPMMARGCNNGSLFDIYRDTSNNNVLWLGNKSGTIWITCF